MPRVPGLRLVGGLTILVAAAGAFFWFAHVEARSRRDPERVSLGGKRYVVEGRTLGGVTIPICPAGTTMVVDVDMDDLVDLYATGCGRHGYVKSRAGALVWVDLGDVDVDDTPGLNSLWAREIRDGGGTFRLAGIACSIVTAGGLAWLVVAVSRRKSQ